MVRSLTSNSVETKIFHNRGTNSILLEMMHAVLFDKAQTIRGKAIVRKHQVQADAAEAACAALVSHHTQSVGADIACRCRH